MSATLRHTGYILRGNPVTLVAGMGAALLVLIALVGPWIVPYGPTVSNVPQALQPPSAAHWFGTDQLGRDVFSRVVVATRLDLAIAASAVSLSFVLGATIGAFCGYHGGRLDRWIGRFVDVLMAFPLFVLAMALVAALGNRVENIIYATAIINLPFYIRFARAEVNVRRNSGWVEAARASGNSHVARGAALPAAQRASRHGGADLAEPRLGHPQCRRPVLPRPRRPGADAGMGHHGRRGCPLHHHRQVVAGGLPRRRADDGRALLQPARRRPARHPRPEDAHMTAPLLAIDDLKVTFSTRNGLVEALKGVSLTLDAGETLGIVGESGSGKSVTAFSVMQLLDRAGRITNGRITFRGQDITRASRHAAAAARRRHVDDLPEPAGGAEPHPHGRPADRRRAARPRAALGREARERALKLLEAVLIRDPEDRLDAYPHELSGGMCQRIMIAMAIACEPALLIADEPTTGLDVTTQKTVMDLLAEITAGAAWR
jgi:ABC-type dipeptide/oligopeptide/nickel transport system ATPase subunit